MYQNKDYSAFRKRVGVSEEDVETVLRGPDSPESAHHPFFDYSLSRIIDAAIIHARSNGNNYWRPYLIEQWSNREGWSRMKADEVEMAKRQIKKIKQDEKDRVLMMYIGRIKPFRIRR